MRVRVQTVNQLPRRYTSIRDAMVKSEKEGLNEYLLVTEDKNSKPMGVYKVDAGDAKITIFTADSRSETKKVISELRKHLHREIIYSYHDGWLREPL